MRGLGLKQSKKQEESEQKILDFMYEMAKIEFEDLKNYTNVVYDFGGKNEPREKWIVHRGFWIRGIARGTGLDKNTVEKAVSRLIRKKKILERPDTIQTRFFQLPFENWKKYYKRSLWNMDERIKKGAYPYVFSVKITRGDPMKRELVRRTKEKKNEN